MRRKSFSASSLMIAACTVLLATAVFEIGGLMAPAAARAQESPAVADANRPAASAGGSRLHRAARAGDVSRIRSLLKRGANPNARDRDGRTPLMDAARAGRLEAMRALLDARANVNAQSRAGGTALIEAARKGRLEAVRLLVDSGANLNHRQRGWGTALEAAERAGHNDVAKLLRDAGAQSSGRTVGDTVCVRPWNGEGFCGVVQSVNKVHYRIRVTEIRGCTQGCAAMAECSAGRAIGLPGGVTEGFELTVPSWCLTDTGVKP
jgi:Ankyrin repeats (3 copies)/Ankyrin repeats (many copies)